MLKMPDNLRVDMAIKYSMDENAKKFSEVSSFFIVSLFYVYLGKGIL